VKTIGLTMKIERSRNSLDILLSRRFGSLVFKNEIGKTKTYCVKGCFFFVFIAKSHVKLYCAFRAKRII
jgi:hypothetical protein